MNATRAGVLLGTAAYMSPEQAKGKQADRRSDIWSFGAVLYEMVTGKPPFSGESVGEVIAAVIKDEPKLDAVPAELRGLVARCLNKDPRQRLQAIGEARIILEEPAPPAQIEASPARRNRPWAWIAAAAVLAIALAFVSYLHVSGSPPGVLKMSVLPPEKATFKSNSLPAVSPDGRRIAFVATSDGKDLLWVRDLDSLAARALTGTDGAMEPFWSPDSRNIAFFAGEKLKKIEVAGGPAQTLCDVGSDGGLGGSWSKSDVIVFAGIGGGTFRISSAGGNATPLTTPDRASGEAYHHFPWFLPDGRHFLYTAAHSGDAQNTAVYVTDLDSKDRKPIVNATSNAVYTPPGYLLFVRERTLLAQRFDTGKLQTTGDAIPIAEQVDNGPNRFVQKQFSVSQNGVLAYAAGGPAGDLMLTWFDRSGKTTGTLGKPGLVDWGAISPDGKTVAVDRVDRQSGWRDIWLHDLERGTASRFTFGPKNNYFPVWSPDGSSIAFYSDRDSPGHPFQKTTNGTAPDEVLSKPVGDPPIGARLDDWSRDGRYLILASGGGNIRTKYDIWVLPLFGERKPFPYLQTEFDEQYARLSPDGHWLAYTSDESKLREIYVQTFPSHAGKWQVSSNGGSKSIWSRDGKELYFLSADGKMMAAAVKGSGAKFDAGVPKPLFDVRLPGGPNAWYDISKDGRFLIPVEAEQTANTPMIVVVNWAAALKK